MTTAGPLVTADVAAAWARLLGHDVTPTTIRSWAQRGHIGRHGRDGRRTLYSLAEIQAHITDTIKATTPVAEDRKACNTSPQ
ncbi:hypothetical protein GCM10010411_63010 [Actinomadura fulvescens]|uniref:Helix-turn-helix domain-containing protein n=1 Tax=Actinomadura fulvescens TaxID=46160 RepID=A0ABP6CJD3_9ACTN